MRKVVRGLIMAGECDRMVQAVDRGAEIGDTGVERGRQAARMSMPKALSACMRHGMGVAGRGRHRGVCKGRLARLVRPIAYQTSAPLGRVHESASCGGWRD